MRLLKLIALNLVTMTVAGVVTLGLIEAGLRLNYYGSLTPFVGGPHLYKPDPKLAFIPNPGIRTAQERIAYVVPITVNSLGMRGRELGPKQGKLRIAVIGDGHVFGSGLSDDDTLPVQLQRALRAQSGKDHYEVVNAGGPAYNTVQQFLRTRDLIGELDADLVILAFNSENDIHYNTAGLRRFMTAGPKRPVARLNANGALEFDYSAPERYFRRHRARLANLKAERPWYLSTALYVRGRVFWRSIGRNKVPDPNIALGMPYLSKFSAAHSPNGLSAEEYDALWHEGWAVTRALVLGMQKSVEATGARFAVTVVPSMDQLAPEYVAQWVAQFDGLALEFTRINRMMESFAIQNGIPVLDGYQRLFEAYEAGEKDLHRSRFDSHLTPKGQRLLAEALAQQVLAGPLLSAP